MRQQVEQLYSEMRSSQVVLEQEEQEEREEQVEHCYLVMVEQEEHLSLVKVVELEHLSLVKVEEPGHMESKVHSAQAVMEEES